jgi:hypothetical protein
MTLRKRDQKLIEKVEVACGLDAIRPSQRLSRDGKQHAMEKDETGNVLILGEPGTLIPFANTEFVAVYPEGHGKRLRYVVLRPHFEEGKIFVGGSTKKSDRPDPDDGHNGLYTLPSGRTVFRRDIPDDYTGREAPAGHYKDLRMVHGKNALSLFSFHPQYREANKHLRRLLMAALPAIEASKTKSDVLEAPDVFVARGTDYVDVRFLHGGFEDVVNVTELLADVMNASHWALPGLVDVMTAKAAGVVRDVGEHHISIEWEDGSGELIHAPRDEIAGYIKVRVPVRTANLPIVPLVREGENIEAGTVLWGGSSQQFVDAKDLLKQVPSDVNEEQQLRLLRIWALLAVGGFRDGHEVYPLEYTIPAKASEVYFMPYTCRVALNKHPAKVMCADATGIHLDFYTLSHRSRHWRRWREKMERQTAAQAAAQTTTTVEEAEVSEEAESAPE